MNEWVDGRMIWRMGAPVWLPLETKIRLKQILKKTFRQGSCFSVPDNQIRQLQQNRRRYTNYNSLALNAINWVSLSETRGDFRNFQRTTQGQLASVWVKSVRLNKTSRRKRGHDSGFARTWPKRTPWHDPVSYKMHFRHASSARSLVNFHGLENCRPSAKVLRSVLRTV